MSGDYGSKTRNMIEKSILLDTSVVIAWFADEPVLKQSKEYFSRIEEGLIDGFISAITLTEVLSVVGKKDSGLAYSMVSYLENSPLRILPVDTSIAKLAGNLRLTYTSLYLSTADCIIVASGIQAGVDKVVTTDRAWKSIADVVIEIV